MTSCGGTDWGEVICTNIYSSVFTYILHTIKAANNDIIDYVTIENICGEWGG